MIAMAVRTALAYRSGFMSSKDITGGAGSAPGNLNRDPLRDGHSGRHNDPDFEGIDLEALLSGTV